jgi:hypothetical protein
LQKNFPVGDGSKLNFCRGQYKSETGKNRRVEAWAKQEKRQANEKRGMRERGNFPGQKHAGAAKVSILIVILLPSVFGETGD